MTSSVPKVKCLVIQLGRQSDCLQSLMALRAAKQLYPQLEIHFVCRERFSDSAKRIPWIEKVIVLPTEKLVGPLLEDTGREAEALAELARWIAPMVNETWDMLMNWTYSDASSYLTALLPAR
ncbi:MAG: hypothetical protein HYX41_08155, partial [Bdellovibrio sp.]|nr:hypothetical protein [Bdellovibrio sp.]